MQAVFVHHAGHGGGSHQRRHKEEEHREHPGNGVHAVGVLGKGDAAHGGGAVQHIPLAFFDLAHLLLGVVQLGKAVCQFLLCLSFLALVLGAGFFQLGLPGIILCPALFQLLLCGIELGIGAGGAGGQLQLPLQKLQFHLAQGGLRLSHQLIVGKAGRGDQPLLVHLPLARVQLLLIALQLVIDVVVSGLRFGQRIPQFNVILVLRLGLVQRLFGVAQSGFCVGQQGVCHLFQVDQQLNLL